VRFEDHKAVTVKITVFWDLTLCSPVVYRRSGGTYCFHLQCLRVSKKQAARRARRSCLAHSSSLKMEAVSFFETSVYLYRTAKCHIEESSSIHSTVPDNIYRHFLNTTQP
jgi:hypothetical protein